MPKMVTTPLSDIANIELLDKRYDIFDSKVRGLGIRISPHGKKSWFVMKRVNGHMVRNTFGSYPDISLANARKLAKRIINLYKNLEEELNVRKESRMTDMTDEELKERIKKLNRRLEEETDKSNPDKELASMLKTDLINALRELVKRMESGWKKKNYN